MVAQHSIQGKYPLAEVIKEVFSVIKLAKIVKKTFSTTSVYGYGGFGRDFNGNSTQLKKLGGRRFLQIFFLSVRVSCLNAPMHFKLYASVW